MGYSIVQITARLWNSKLSTKVLLVSTIGFGLLWAVSGFVSPQTAKYPPDALYLLYGIMASCCICSMVRGKDFSKYYRLNQAIEWLSKNSFSIYLWHIIPVTIIQRSSLESLFFLVKYALILVTACMLTYMQSIITN